MATAETPPMHGKPVANDLVAAAHQAKTVGPASVEQTISIEEAAAAGTPEATTHQPAAKSDPMTIPEPAVADVEPSRADTGSGEMIVETGASPRTSKALSPTSKQGSGSPRPKDKEHNATSPTSRKRDASEAGLEPEHDRPPQERRRDFSQEEKKRGQRLFGGLLSTLSQKPAAGRRQPTERRQHERTQQRKDEDNKRKAQVQEKLAKFNRRRKVQQVKLDEQTMCARHDDMLAKAHSLQTKTRPPIYYRPWELTREQEETTDEQVRDAKEVIAQEVAEFERTKQQRLEQLGIHSPKKPASGSIDGIVSTVGEPSDTRVPNATRTAESTNHPPSKHADKDHDEVVETEEDTVIY